MTERIWTDYQGHGIADEITTRWEPWGCMVDHFKVYKGSRAYPMACWASDGAGVLHPIPQQPII
ncbi:MAG: hypothetical protein JXQ91_07630 [Vannielia sp.]|uniref:hypothetical protein n=1 Tax=Vannielia sp. TaxID=2813045 RepID=UPI003B8E548F